MLATGAMPTALRGHGNSTCPRKAVGMAPLEPAMSHGASRRAQRRKLLFLPEAIEGAVLRADEQLAVGDGDGAGHGTVELNALDLGPLVEVDNVRGPVDRAGVEALAPDRRGRSD